MLSLKVMVQPVEVSALSVAVVSMQAFKPHLAPFLEPLFASLQGGHGRAQVAAGACISQLRDMLGPNIWAGRLTEEWLQAQKQSPYVMPVAGRFAPRT